MEIIRFKDFMTEGMLSDIAKSVGSALKGKKSKVQEILNTIESTKMESVKQVDSYRKELNELSKRTQDRESSFDIEVLNKTLKSYQLAKNQEIENLRRKALEIIGKESDLLISFNSQYARIEVKAAEDALKMARKYETEDNLKKISNDFERLSLNADRISRDEEKYSSYNDQGNSGFDVLDPELEDILAMDFIAFQRFVQEKDERELESIELKLRKYSWSLQKLMDRKTSNIRKKLVKARRDEDIYLEAILRKEIREIESSYREEYRLVKDKRSAIEKIMKKNYDPTKNK